MILIGCQLSIVHTIALKVIPTISFFNIVWGADVAIVMSYSHI